MDLQGLRALAVGLVVLNHAFEWPAGGFIGVDIFFVLSGFLMTSVLHREYERSGRIRFAAFYRRRIRRLIPASVVVIAATVVGAWLLFASGRFISTLWDAAASLVFVANWRYAAQATDYFAQGAQTSPLQHYWSLSLEEQYYLVWPLAILVIALIAARTKAPRVAAALTTLAITVALFLLAVVLTNADTSTAYFITPARLWELSVGATVALCMPWFSRMPMAMRPYIALLAIGGMVLAAAITPSGQGFPAPWAALAVLSAAAFIAFPWQPARARLHPLDNPVLGYIGDISYSLYLWHFPALILITELSRGLPGDKTPIPALEAIALSLVLAALSFRFVEEPIRRSSWLEPSKRRSSAGRAQLFRSVGLAALGIVVVGAVGIALSVDRTARNPVAEKPNSTSTSSPTALPGGADGGVTGDAALAALKTELTDALGQKTWPELTPSMDSVVSSYARDSQTNDCSNPDYPGVDKCTWGSPDAPHSIVVAGDSTSVGYIPMFRALADASNGQLKVTAFGMYGCPFVDFETQNGGEAYNKACPGRKEMAIEKVAELKPDAVFITNTYISLKKTSNGQPFTPAEYKAGLKPFMERLAPNTGKVVLLSPPPAQQNVKECYSPRSTPQACVTKVPGRWQAMGSEELALAKDFDGAWIDSRPLFCVQSSCPAFSAGMPVKFDDLHLTEEYSRHIANGVVALLAKEGISLTGDPATTEPTGSQEPSEVPAG
jgi:peptidoglycan/LPS O-acetylase OafA/YrhL